MFYADAMGFLAKQMAPPFAHPDLPKHLSLIHTTAAPPIPGAFGKTEQILGEVKKFRETLDAQEHLTTILSRTDLESIRVGEQTGVVLGLQMAPYDISRRNLQRLFDAGIRVIGTSYQGERGRDDHPLGGGFLAPSKDLTSLGAEFLNWCKDLHMIVDLSHAGHRTAESIVEENPGAWLMASHGGVLEECVHPRNLPRNVLTQIILQNGYVGIYAMTFGVSHSIDSVQAVGQHLMHLINRCGDAATCMGIGSDGVYQTLDIDEWKAQVEFMKPRFDPTGTLGVRWPDQPLEINCVSKMQAIESHVTLFSRYPDLLGENLRQFFLRSLPA